MEAEKENQYKKGLWTEEEDRILLEYIRVHGRGKWNRIPKVTGNQETKLIYDLFSSSIIPSSIYIYLKYGSRRFKEVWEEL